MQDRDLILCLREEGAAVSLYTVVMKIRGNHGRGGRRIKGSRKWNPKIGLSRLPILDIALPGALSVCVCKT